MIDTANLNKLKIALQQVEAGEELHTAVANAEYVNYDQRLIDKINVLKNIPVLNADVLKYLYSIKLTDKIENVQPKVDAIYQLALSAKLIEDKALEKEEEKHNAENEEVKIAGKNQNDIAVNVINAILNINK